MDTYLPRGAKTATKTVEPRASFNPHATYMGMDPADVEQPVIRTWDPAPSARKPLHQVIFDALRLRR